MEPEAISSRPAFSKLSCEEMKREEPKGRFILLKDHPGDPSSKDQISRVDEVSSEIFMKRLILITILKMKIKMSP